MLPSVGDTNPQISLLGSLAAIQWTYRICKFMKECDWSINTAATAVPLTAHPTVVAIRHSFRGELYSLRVLSIYFYRQFYPHSINVHITNHITNPSLSSFTHPFPGLPWWTITKTVSSELLSFCFFVLVPCAILSWPFRLLMSARKYTISYRIVS